MNSMLHTFFRHPIVSRILILTFLLVPSFLIWQTSFTETQKMVTNNWAQKLTGGDQHGIYVTFKEAMEGQVPRGIKNGWVAVGYLSMIGFYHQASALWTTPNIENSFIFHGFIYSVLLGFVSILFMYRVARHQSPNSNPILIALSCALLWFAFFKLSATLRFSYLPWSHYASGFIGMCFLWLSYESIISRKRKWIFFAGFCGSLFFYTRRHEASAIFLAISISLFAISCHSFYLSYKENNKFTQWVSNSFKFLRPKFIPLIAGVVFSILFIKYFSNWMPMNSHYEQQRVTNTYVSEYLRIYPQMIPLRIIQTFIDPDYFSYGNKYTTEVIVDRSYGLDNFPMPMLLQIPILLYLIPAALIGFFILMRRKKFWETKISPSVLALLLGGLTFSIITCGYLATAVWGGVHLKHGLVREFILAVTALLVSCGPAMILGIFENQYSKKMWLIPLFGILIFPLGIGQSYFGNSNVLNLPSTHMGPIKSSYSCEDGLCHAELKYFFENGTEFKAPFNHIIINQHCPEGFKDNPLALGESGSTVMGPSFRFEIINCPSAVDVEVYPLFTGYCGSGLPPLKFSTCPNKGFAPNCKPPESL